MRSANLISTITAALMFVGANLQAQVPQYSVTVLPVASSTQYGMTQPEGLNNLGEVVGSEYNGHGTFAYLYSNGTTLDLGALIGGEGNIAYGINDMQEVGGEATFPVSPGLEYINAFVFSLTEGVKYLNGTMASAFGINNAGQIEGSGSSNGAPAILLPNGTVIDLKHDTQSPYGQVNVINDNYTSNGVGQAIGSFSYGEGDFFYSNGVMSMISSIACLQNDVCGSYANGY